MSAEKIYLLWAERTPFFKVGITRQTVGKRASNIQTDCPFPLRVIGYFPGCRADEKALHEQLASYRTHGEWFALPEEEVWKLLPSFL
jgi:hypothetical protein